METAIQKWGNRAAIRLTVAVMKACHLELDQIVELRQEGRRLVMFPQHAIPAGPEVPVCVETHDQVS
jgi:antitoxin MazE